MTKANDTKIKEVISKLDKRVMLYDPPEGWRYGFPKEYKPSSPGEPLAETLRRDGYPDHLLDLAQYTRFWEKP